MAREDWLNGWPRMGSTAVLIGTSVRCVGCGKDHGITTVAFDGETVFPSQEPAWPVMCWSSAMLKAVTYNA